MINVNEIMRQPVYEPRKRWCGGRYGWVAHRFPVKGGISMRDVWMQQSLETHPLTQAILKVVAERRA